MAAGRRARRRLAGASALALALLAGAAALGIDPDRRRALVLAAGDPVTEST